jgi:hypothetical protein
MCLTCGCMDAHLEVGDKDIRYEDIAAAAEQNDLSIAEIFDIVERTIAKDRADHPQEYAT